MAVMIETAHAVVVPIENQQPAFAVEGEIDRPIQDDVFGQRTLTPESPIPGAHHGANHVGIGAGRLSISGRLVAASARKE